MATVVVPFRSGGKSRLPAEVRVELALAMLGDVLEAAVTHDDRRAARHRRCCGGCGRTCARGGGDRRSRRRPGSSGGGCARSESKAPASSSTPTFRALTAGRARAARGARSCPRRLRRTGRPTRSRCPIAPGSGPPTAPGSAARFAAAGLGPATILELEHDVDTLDDLEQLERLSLPLGRRTKLVLNQHKVLAARTA